MASDGEGMEFFPGALSICFRIFVAELQEAIEINTEMKKD
jgi:hypothetical protein